MLDRLKRLTIKRQLAIAGSLVAIPMVVLVGRDIVSHAGRIDAARTEIAGLDDLMPHRALLQAVPRHRALAQARIGGDSTVDGQIETLARRIDGLITRADGGGAAAPADLRQRWNSLTEDGNGRSALRTAGAHAQVMDAVAVEMDAIAHRSGLLPSRSPDTYRLAHLVVRTVPAIIATLDEALALEQALRGGAASFDDTAALERRFFALDIAGARVGEMLSTMTPGPEKDDLIAALARLAAIEKALSEGRGGSTDQRLASLGEEALETAFAIHDGVSDALAQRLSARVAALQTTRNVEVAALAVALCLIGLLLAIIGRSITQPIGRVVDICRHLVAGQYDQRLNRDVGGDMGVVIRALDDLQDELASERRTRQEAEREREGLRDQFVQAQKMGRWEPWPAELRTISTTSSQPSSDRPNWRCSHRKAASPSETGLPGWSRPDCEPRPWSNRS